MIIFKEDGPNSTYSCKNMPTSRSFYKQVNKHSVYKYNITIIAINTINMQQHYCLLQVCCSPSWASPHIHSILPAFHAKHHVEILRFYWEFLLRISIQKFHVHLRDFHLFISDPPVGPAGPSLDSTEYRMPSPAEPDVLKEFEACLESPYDPEACLPTPAESSVCRESP